MDPFIYNTFKYQPPPSSHYPPPSTPSYSYLSSTSNHPKQQYWRESIYNMVKESDEQIEALRHMLRLGPKVHNPSNLTMNQIDWRNGVDVNYHGYQNENKMDFYTSME